MYLVHFYGTIYLPSTTEVTFVDYPYLLKRTQVQRVLGGGKWRKEKR